MEKATILIVDDSPENLDALESLLSEKYDLKAAPNGKIALKIANSTPKPDLILLDIIMPEMDGYQVCKQLKSSPETESIPVIFLSAMSEEKDQIEGLEWGAVDYVSKPFKPKILEARVKTHLELKRSKDELRKTADILSQLLDEKNVLISELQEARRKIEKELSLAKEVQQRMLPRNYPLLKELDIYAKLIPARDVGGDLYDFFSIDNENICFAVGDVSGKGIPAALYMAVTKTLLRAKTSLFADSAEVITAMNKDLCMENEMDMFVTFFFCILNIKTGILKYCNAGHNPPIIFQAGKGFDYMQIEKPSLPLGIYEDTKYISYQLQLNPNDIFFLYTDGITEAINKNNVQFSEKRLLEAIANVKNESLENMTKNILETVVKHADGMEQSDDITILIFKYN